MVTQEQTNQRIREWVNGKDVENEEKEEINDFCTEIPNQLFGHEFSVQFKWVEICAKYLTKKVSFEHKTK